MKPSDMLHQMCEVVLAGTDIKALCKARGLPSQAASSRDVLETVFLSPQGISDVFNSLGQREVAVLHLLKNSDSPVDVSFFNRIYGFKDSYGTFNQRFQDVFAKVKKTLVRNGVLLWAAARQNSWDKKTNMERWRFLLPAEFHIHLPPLIPTPRQFDGDGSWRPNVARDKLNTDLGRSHNEADAKAKVFQIHERELQLNGKRFAAAELIVWQQSGWKQALGGKKKSPADDSYSKSPDEAALCILSDLAAGLWADAEQLNEPLRIFCGNKVDADTVCQSGWEWGLLARRQADGKTWYRLAPQPTRGAPLHYLTANDRDGCVTVDLATIPFDALEQIVEISDQRAGSSADRLLISPNIIKLGRANDDLLTSEAVDYLLEHTRPFAEAHVKLGERRGKTILHENLLIARVSDLSLKVAIEKVLGRNLVALKNDFIAFPNDSLDDVQRVVKKSGHVVKGVTAK